MHGTTGNAADVTRRIVVVDGGWGLDEFSDDQRNKDRNNVDCNVGVRQIQLETAETFLELEMEATFIKNRILPASASDIRTTIKIHTTNTTTITTTTKTSASTMTTRFAANIIPNCSRYRSYNLNRSLKCLSAVRWNTQCTTQSFWIFCIKLNNNHCILKNLLINRLYCIDIDNDRSESYKMLPIVVVAVPDVENSTRLTENPKPKKTISRKVFAIYNYRIIHRIQFLLGPQYCLYIYIYIYNIWFLFCISCHEPQNYKSSFNFI